MGAETGVSGLLHRCNEQETAYNRVLHRAGNKKQPTIIP